MTSPSWAVPAGDRLIRQQIHREYGDNPQAGISRSRTTPNGLVFSDRDRAAAIGYDFDGWDGSKQVYY